MAWSFHPTPRRLLQDVRVLTLDQHDRAVLLSLYVGSDEHGRFQHHPVALAVSLGMVGPGWDPAAAVERLGASGLLHLYPAADGYTYGQLDQWDADLGADHKGKRPKSNHPSPPAAIWELAGCDGKFRGGRHKPGSPPNATLVDDPEQDPNAVRTRSEQDPNTVRTRSERRPPNKGRKEGKKKGMGLSDLSINEEEAERRREVRRGQLDQL